MPRVHGHREGAKTVRMVVEESRKLGIRYITLFAFSTENWNRPPTEVSALMSLFQYHLEHELKDLTKNGVRLRAIGDRTKLPKGVSDLLSAVEASTVNNSELDLLLAVSYGGRDEIVHAARALASKVERGELKASEIDAAQFTSQLYAPDVPDPDLLIRTSNECRISNFLLWQLAYAEIVLSEKYWPEFTKEEYHNCLNRYAGRQRRFGLTEEQIK